eukprot:3754000-Rhodomonas_salina.4
MKCVTSQAQARVAPPPRPCLPSWLALAGSDAEAVTDCCSHGVGEERNPGCHGVCILVLRFLICMRTRLS